MNLSELARSILSEVGYIQMWKSENTLESQGRLENIEEFINSLADFSTMVEFLEYVSLIEARDDKNLTDAISVMTVHGAKGLEFDLVFVPGLEDGLFPSGKSIDERNGLEEERRLMYVAITRAKKELVLSYAKSRYIFGDYQMQMPSRFLKELPESEVIFEEVGFGSDFLFNKRSDNYENRYAAPASKFSQSYNKPSSLYSKPVTTTYTKPSPKSEDPFANKRIFHQKFGYGKILSSDGNKLEIAFEKSGTKTVMKDFVTAA